MSEFARHVAALAPVFTAAPGGQEFHRPTGWQHTKQPDSHTNLDRWVYGHAICAVLGEHLAVVDVDPRNDGDAERVRQVLDGLRVQVFAEVATPGGGRHFYVAGHPDLPSCKPLRGVDVQSHGTNVFLPGTRRPKYDGAGYEVLFDNLEALEDGGDPDGAEALVGWVQQHRQAEVQPVGEAQPWDGQPPDEREAAYLRAVLDGQHAEVAQAAPGTRNQALYTAAMKCGNYVTGAGLEEAEVVRTLYDAATVNGLLAEDGEAAVHATIRSGLSNGKASPRAVPQPPAVSVLESTGAQDYAPADDALLGKVLRRSDLAHLPPVQPLVKGLLDYPTAAVLVGSYGIGKTFLALALACCVATGRPWLGQPVERRKVLLVIGEGGTGLDKRIAAWEQGFNNGEPISDDDLLIVVQPRTLTNPNVWQRIAEQCVAEGVGFVVLDTLSSLAPDADETKDAAKLVDLMHRLATGTNGTVLLVHHPGWGDSGRTRGGYQFEANTDTVLLLTGTPEEPLVQLSRKKAKDDQQGQTYWMRRTPFALHGEHLGETSVVLARVDPAQVGVPIIERIKLVLDGCGEQGATGPQIMAELGVPTEQRSTFYRHLGKAVGDGLAVKRGTGNQQRYYAAGGS